MWGVMGFGKFVWVVVVLEGMHCYSLSVQSSGGDGVCEWVVYVVLVLEIDERSEARIRCVLFTCGWWLMGGDLVCVLDFDWCEGWRVSMCRVSVLLIDLQILCGVM